MPSMSQLSNYATTIATVCGETRVTYQTTEIVCFTDDTVTLDSGGWRTVTTKRKMNQAANQFGLGYSVTQRKGQWFVWIAAEAREVPFADGMRIAR